MSVYQRVTGGPGGGAGPGCDRVVLYRVSENELYFFSRSLKYTTIKQNHKNHLAPAGASKLSPRWKISRSGFLKKSTAIQKFEFSEKKLLRPREVRIEYIIVTNRVTTPAARSEKIFHNFSNLPAWGRYRICWRESAKGVKGSSTSRSVFGSSPPSKLRF